MSGTSSGKWVYPKPKATPGKVCKDCLADWRLDRASDETAMPMKMRRPAPHPGPRCATHHNAERRARRIASKVKRIENTYQLSAADYDALYAFQGGRCALCRRATGATQRLAVDHDHRQALLDGHDPKKGCHNCVRGLVCSVCNDVLAHARDDHAFGYRVASYLLLPPWRRRLRRMAWPPVSLPEGNGVR